eukprot:8522599-Alexandrium_andersonii.AAC.1
MAAWVVGRPSVPGWLRFPWSAPRARGVLGRRPRPDPSTSLPSSFKGGPSPEGSCPLGSDRRPALFALCRPLGERRGGVGERARAPAHALSMSEGREE